MKLTTEQWATLATLLESGMDLPRGEQRAWADGLTGLDPELKSALLQMLDRGADLDEKGGNSDFLKTLPKLTLSSSDASPEPTLTSQVIGPYRLVRELGRGGMGAVWLAERVDGEMTRQAAIKLPHAAIQNSQFLERFRRERDFLAALTHPNIAQIYDAGVTPGDGRPYLVMEYVDGEPIDIHCERVGIREKLELFVPVCEAVSYAHEHLIVHRDLKPSNIVVDQSGQPKLLDFGIAKLLDDAGDSTSTFERLLTPGYASPEQIQGGAQTTKTDVYSLGAVLYKLLTGRSPHVSDSGTSQAIEIAAGKAAIPDAKTLNPALPLDLTFILRKALRREPEERYTSVESLAEDIRAFLDGKPVRAREGDAWYRTRKFLRFYWIPVTAAMLVIASLATGLYIANRQRAIAQQRFSEVRQLAHTFVYEVYDDVTKLQGSTKTREMMVRTGLQYLARLGENAGNDLGLQREIAAAYAKIGDAQGSPTMPSLGHAQDALESQRKALEIYQRIAAKDPVYLRDLASQYMAYAGLMRVTGHLQQSAELSQSSLSTYARMRTSSQPFNKNTEGMYIKAWCTAGDTDEELGLSHQAWTEFARCRELAAAQAKRYPEPEWFYLAASAAERRGTAAQGLGMLTVALEAFDEGDSLIRQALAQEPRNPGFRRVQAVLYQFRSRVYFDDATPNFDDPVHALEYARKYLDATGEMVRHDPQDRSSQRSNAIAMYRVSLTLSLIDPQAAAKMAGDSVRVFDQFIAAGRKDPVMMGYWASSMQRLARAQLAAGRAAEARTSAEAALVTTRTLVTGPEARPRDIEDLVFALILTGRAAAAVKDWAHAEALLREAREHALPMVKPEDLRSFIPLATAEQTLAAFLQSRGRAAEAHGCYRNLVGLWQRPAEQSEYVTSQRALAEKLLASSPSAP